MRVTIFRSDKIGDLIVSSPVFAAIKAAHPHAKILLVASPYNAVAAIGHDELVLFDKNNKAEALAKIKAFKPTHTLVLSPKNDCYFMALLSGAKYRGGILMGYRWLPRLLSFILLTHSVFMAREKRPHQTDAALKLARDMGLAGDGKFPYRIARDGEARSVLQQLNITQPFIAVHLADKFAPWSHDDVRQFLKRVEGETGCMIIATAGPVDKALSMALAHDFTILENLSFPEWTEVFAAAKAVIAPDCAAVHVACALEKPLLALYLSSRFDVAMQEFGPRGTRSISHALGDPKTDIPVFLSDLKALLT
jgi:ADP-heptose:LPS heptosyltransferase